MAISDFRFALKCGFMKSCHEFPALRLLPRPLYAAAKTEGGQRMDIPDK